MKPIYEAKKIAVEAGNDFEKELAFYLEHGGVISLPDRFIMGRAIQLSLGDEVINPPNPDCWYVHYAAGRNALEWFVAQAPYFLPYMGWTRNKGRNDRFRAYPTTLLCAKLARKEHHGLC